MESKKELPKFAVLQLSGCSGCEVSLLNSDEWINDFNLVYMPLVVTTNKIPDDVEVLLVSGGVRTDEDIHNLRKGASRSKKVIAVGTCALSGGVAQIRETHQARDTYLLSSHRLRLPDMLPRAFPIDRFVPVDLYLPGCPPTPQLFMTALKEGENAKIASIVCQECGRQKLQDMRPTSITGMRSGVTLPDICLINQGYLCVGTSTRGGCGALCTRPGHACVGCRGPANPYLNKEPKFVLDNLRRVFTRMTDIPEEEINEALESPWLSLFLDQFTDYTQDESLPLRTKEKMI
ncbi:MAG: hypothetical protein GX544_03675 [Chloroflexi bacterium]|jgi:F420-non-reducing hydrogenase small subunit|nr:hypothetical protein [Chloroflexota bacterium]